MTRTRHYGGDSSPHDKSHPDNYGGYRRPLGAPPPDNPGIKPRASKGCALVLLAAAGGALGLVRVVVDLVRAVA